MPPGTTGGLGAVPFYLLFLVLPGLAFAKAFIFAERRLDTLERWDKLGYVLLGGVLSALTLVIAFRFFAAEPKIRGTNISEITVLAMLVGVTIQSVLASGLGLGLGMLRYKFGSNLSNTIQNKIRDWSGDVGRQFNDREEPWDLVIDNIRDQEVKVVTTDEQEIVGYVARFSSTRERRTLVLSPVEPRTQEMIGPANTGTNAVYIHDSEISHIAFRDEEADDEYADILIQGDVEPPEDGAKSGDENSE